MFVYDDMEVSTGQIHIIYMLVADCHQLTVMFVTLCPELISVSARELSKGRIIVIHRCDMTGELSCPMTYDFL